MKKTIILAITIFTFLVFFAQLPKTALSEGKIYNIRVSSSLNGTATCNGFVARENSSVMVPVSEHGELRCFFTPNAGYELRTLICPVQWCPGYRPVSDLIIKDVTQAFSVSAWYEQRRLSINYEVSAGGRMLIENSPIVGPITGTYPVIFGKSYKIKVYPNPGYVIKNLFVDGTAIESEFGILAPEYKFENITDSHTIKIVLERGFNYVVGVYGRASFNGEEPIRGLSAGPYFNSGRNTTLSIYPDPGYKVDSLRVDGVNIGAPESYVVSNIVSYIVVEFIAKEFPILYKIELGGRIKISQTTSSVTIYGPSEDSYMVPPHSNVNISIIPNPGYLLEEAFIDGTSIGTRSNYTFTDVWIPHNIEAYFKWIGPCPDVSPKDGRVTQTDAQYVISRLGTRDLTADINGDGRVTPTDAIYVINRLETTVTCATIGSIYPNNYIAGISNSLFQVLEALKELISR